MLTNTSGDKGARVGFWVLEAADLDEALAWGREAVVACRAPVEERDRYSAVGRFHFDRPGYEALLSLYLHEVAFSASSRHARKGPL